MFASKTDAMTGAKPAITPINGVVVQRAAITAVAADVALNAVGAFLILPAGCVPVGVHLDADAAVTASVGVCNAAETALDVVLATGVAANGASMTCSTAMLRTAASTVDRKVGIQVTTAGTAGVVGMTLSYRAV